jgi:hypothetical protein
MTYARALELFRTLGASDPEWRAKSESKDGEPQLARWLFMQGLWSNVIPDEYAWPGKWFDLDAPVPAAARRMLARGIDPNDLTTVVRDAQILLLFNVCQLLDSSAHGIEDLQEKIAENVEWRLVEYDGKTGKTKRLIEGLHEGFHDADPTGRDGGPRVSTQSRAAAAKKTATKKTATGKTATKKPATKKPATKKTATKKTATKKPGKPRRGHGRGAA